MGFIELLLTTVVPALLPAAVDGVKGAINHFSGGSQMKPANFQEWIEYSKASVERMRALSELDKPVGAISQWVSDLRASTRYIMVYIILIVWGVTGVAEAYAVIPAGSEFMEESSRMARVAFSFLFGDRMYHKLKNG